MPPVIEERTEIDEVLAENPELEGLESSKFVFTDITYDLSDRVKSNSFFFFSILNTRVDFIKAFMKICGNTMYEPLSMSYDGSKKNV